MADPGIKNIIVKKELLGKVTTENGRIARFRLVSEDKNRKSAWSQIFVVNLLKKFHYKKLINF